MLELGYTMTSTWRGHSEDERQEDWPRDVRRLTLYLITYPNGKPVMTIFALEGSYVLTYCQCLHHRQGINCSLLHALFYYICNLSCVPVQSVPNVYILPSSVLGSLFSNSSFYLMVTSKQSGELHCFSFIQHTTPNGSKLLL